MSKKIIPNTQMIPHFPSSGEIGEAQVIDINKLSDEVLAKIFSFLNVRDFAAVPCVCHRWAMISGDDFLWKRFFKKDFKEYKQGDFYVLNLDSHLPSDLKKAAIYFPCPFKKGFTTNECNKSLYKIFFMPVAVLEYSSGPTEKIQQRDQEVKSIHEKVMIHLIDLLNDTQEKSSQFNDQINKNIDLLSTDSPEIEEYVMMQVTRHTEAIVEICSRMKRYSQQHVEITKRSTESLLARGRIFGDNLNNFIKKIEKFRKLQNNLEKLTEDLESYKNEVNNMLERQNQLPDDKELNEICERNCETRADAVEFNKAFKQFVETMRTHWVVPLDLLGFHLKRTVTRLDADFVTRHESSPLEEIARALQQQIQNQRDLCHKKIFAMLEADPTIWTLNFPQVDNGKDKRT